MGRIAEACCQYFIFFVKGFIFIQDDHIFTSNLTQTTFYPDTGYPQILFGYRNIQFFSKIFELLIDLFGLHADISHLFIIGKALKNPLAGGFNLEKSMSCVILSR